MSDNSQVFAYPPTRFLQAFEYDQIRKVIDFNKLAALSFKIKPSDITALASSPAELEIYINSIAIIRELAKQDILQDLAKGEASEYKARYEKTQSANQKISLLVKQAKKMTAKRKGLEARPTNETKSELRERDKQLILMYSVPYDILRLRCISAHLGAVMPHGSLPVSREEALFCLILSLSDYLITQI